MLRLSLEELILQILALDLGDPYDFLEAAISPPESLSIRNALKFLGKKINVIYLTPLIHANKDTRLSVFLMADT
jgi:hypothetical protein